MGHVDFDRHAVAPQAVQDMESSIAALTETPFARTTFVGGVVSARGWELDVGGHESQGSVESQRYVVAAMVRLDNRPQLARDLGMQQNGDLRDIEVLLFAFEKWGTDAFNRLQGDWCCAIWDKQRHSLTLARDATGNSGLMWWHKGAQVVFANSLACVVGHPDVPKVPNPLVIACFLAHFDDPEIEDATFFSGVRRLLPGCYVVISGASQESKRCWWRPESLDRLRFSSEEECDEAFMALYNEAVSTRLQAPGGKRIALALSGGLDSCSVLALAAPVLARRGQGLKAYVHRPQDGGGQFGEGAVDDEFDVACEAAEFVGNSDVQSLRSEGVYWTASIDESIKTYGEPTFAASAYYWLSSLMARLTQDHCAVLLTGQGGNSTVSWLGTGNLWPEIAHHSPFWTWGQLAQNRLGLRAAVRMQLLSPVRRWLCQELLMRCRGGGAQASWQSDSVIHPEFAKAMRIEERVRAVGHNVSGLAGASFHEIRKFRLMGSSGNSLGTRWMELGNRYGISARDPTRDRRIVEFCWRLPDHFFWGGGHQRMLVRRGFAGRLPPAMLRRPTRGVQGVDMVGRAHVEHMVIEAWLEQAKKNHVLAHWLDVDLLQKIQSTLGHTGFSDQYRILLSKLGPGLALARFAESQHWS